MLTCSSVAMTMFRSMRSTRASMSLPLARCLQAGTGRVDDPRVDFFHGRAPVFAMFTVSHEAIQGGFRSSSNASWLFRYKQGSGQREARIQNHLDNTSF
ncbi:Acp5 [Symbiodinium pilosum]|uniref:Acp5 protein n=1 Tax=Symbiodinium pilosum TaxID=2952 RepID=A0A812VH30_SYMPI|nr:Acp5 [Symbiodinium pilosum]